MQACGSCVCAEKSYSNPDRTYTITTSALSSLSVTGSSPKAVWARWCLEPTCSRGLVLCQAWPIQCCQLHTCSHTHSMCRKHIPCGEKSVAISVSVTRMGLLAGPEILLAVIWYDPYKICTNFHHRILITKTKKGPISCMQVQWGPDVVVVVFVVCCWFSH